MNAMMEVSAVELQWYALRMKRAASGGHRTVCLDAEMETFRNRQGVLCHRPVPGTGHRVHLPAHLLRRAGFEVFLPMKLVRQRRSRVYPSHVLVSYPLLVDWIFVGWPMDQARWHDLVALNCVVGVLGNGGKPVRVPERMVHRLMKRWGAGVVDKRRMAAMAARVPFSMGEMARVLSGPFEGFDLRVIEDDGAQVRGLMDLMGRGTPATVSARDLK